MSDDYCIENDMPRQKELAEIERERLSQLYSINTTNVWAKGQLNIVADMLQNKGLSWYAEEIRKISDSIIILKKHGELKP